MECDSRAFVVAAVSFLQLCLPAFGAASATTVAADATHQASILLQTKHVVDLRTLDEEEDTSQEQLESRKFHALLSGDDPICDDPIVSTWCYMDFIVDTCPETCGKPGAVTDAPTTTTTTTTTLTPNLATLFTCPSGEAALTTQCMTSTRYADISNAVKLLFRMLPKECSTTYCPQSDFAGCVLRMAGHDFMDFDSSKGVTQPNHWDAVDSSAIGGSDGCVDMDDPDNRGLYSCLLGGEHNVSVKDAYDYFCTDVSLADFFVIAAEAVMMETRQVALGEGKALDVDFASRFRYGRTSRVKCKFARGRLPDAEGGCDAVQRTFVDRMGLDWRTSAALMGVHTLGKAEIKNSGYHGRWSDSENSRKFNNDYFLSIIAKGWAQQPVPGNPNKNQWMRVDEGTFKPVKDGRDTANHAFLQNSDWPKIQHDFTELYESVSPNDEMMLSTDLCPAYGPHALPPKPNNGGISQCCLWTKSRDLVPDGHGTYNLYDIGTKEPVLNGQAFCGLTNYDVGCFDISRRQCCPGILGIPEAREYLTQGDPSKVQAGKSGNGGLKWGNAVDCGVSEHNHSHRVFKDAPARRHIIEFAENEGSWLVAFMEGWVRATENGYKPHWNHGKELHNLQSSC